MLRSIPTLLREGKVEGIEAVGHRAAHGADRFREATRLDDAVIAGIEALSAMAPLHNPPALEGIRVARGAWPDVPQVSVFDTAFHADMPPAATTYAVPEGWRRAGIRRFGFHGTSHKYVMERVTAALEVSPRELRSGLAGLSGRGNDLRDIEAAAAQGDAPSQLALTVYAYRAPGSGLSRSRDRHAGPRAMDDRAGSPSLSRHGASACLTTERSHT